MQPGLGIQVIDGVGGQVMVDHGQAHAVEGGIGRQPLAGGGHDHRLVVGVRAAEHQVRVRRLEAVGAAKQVDLPRLQGSDGLVTIGKTANLDGNAQQFADQPGEVGRQPLVFVVTDIDIEGGVVGR
ncbi:hypothetical protein D3C77_450920 [compost metagenome]